MELFEMSASTLAELMKKKEVSAREVVQSQYMRIKQVDNQIHAYTVLCEEDAFKRADALDQRRAKGEKLSALAGIPVGIKENICTKGLQTSCGSKMLAGFNPPYNATVIERLLEQDAIIIGKLNMDEFAMGSSTETSYFGATKNPYDLTRVPGGSSGGSAAAVAAFECAVSLGSDTGGSIRQPASFCGVLGLKPTYGRVSRYGLVAFASSLDQIGPFARSIDDLALIYHAISGEDPLDATTACKDEIENSGLKSFDCKGMRIGLPKEYFQSIENPIIQEKILDMAKLLQERGAILEETSFSFAEYALPAYYIISSAEASSNLARYDGVRYGYRIPEYKNLTEMYEKTRSEGFGNEVKRRIMLGTFVLSSGYYDAYYKRAKLLQRHVTEEMKKQFDKFDFILTPTVTNTAFCIGEEMNDPIKMYYNDFCTVSVNIAGLPAMSIPCGRDAKGLPIGMQLIGPHFSEENLLQAGKILEQAVGGFTGIKDIREDI